MASASDSSDSFADTELPITEISFASSSSASNESISISSSFATVNTAQQISSDYGSDSAENLSPEQLIALDRQKHDPPSYYQEPSLNKGPVDTVPRLCNVSSQYAINDLAIYSAMDDPVQQYKLKSIAQSVAHLEMDRLQQLPAETAHGIDQSQIIYEDGAIYFREY